MMLRTPLSASLIALAAYAAWANDAPTVDTTRMGDVDFGIICPVGDVVNIPADGTSLGYIGERQSDQTIRISTRIIPLVKGLGFGVRATNITSGTLNPVTVTVTHPKFPGYSSTEDVWIDAFEQDSINFNFFTFEFPFEMQQGTWTITASHNDSALYSVAFDIVSPAKVPHLATVCAGDPAIS